MKMYVLSFAAGALVGIIYSFLRIRSPAPPLVALVGLLGILLGEQAIPLAKHVFAGNTLLHAWRNTGSRSHIFGELPGQNTVTPTDVESHPEPSS